MSRMRLTIDDSGRVTIAYVDGITGESYRRRFSAGSSEETYITEYHHDGKIGQVCEALANRGNTLRATRATLAAVIRREYRALRRAERRVTKGWGR